MSKRDPALLISDILESANNIINYTNDLSYEDFLKDQKTVDAVIGILKLLVKHPIGFLKILKINIL
jgi:uncharacterized protein with HEPN domain